MSKQFFNLINSQVKYNAKHAIDHAPEGYVCEIKEPTRTLEQNAKMWPMLQDIARQVCWCEFWMTDEEWKDFFTAILKGQKIVPNMDKSGFIAVGGRTSQMGKKEFIDLIDLMYAFGAEHDVRWSEPGFHKPEIAENMVE